MTERDAAKPGSQHIDPEMLAKLALERKLAGTIRQWVTDEAGCERNVEHGMARLAQSEAVIDELLGMKSAPAPAPLSLAGQG